MCQHSYYYNAPPAIQHHVETTQPATARRQNKEKDITMTEQMAKLKGLEQCK